MPSTGAGMGRLPANSYKQVRKAALLAFAPVAFELMTGIFEIASFLWIEFGLGSADFADQEMEVGRLFFVPDKSGKREFLDGHQIPPGGKHSRVSRRIFWTGGFHAPVFDFGEG